MKALIFAAGLGTRLKPLTDNLPKALAPLAGKTLLWHVIMRLHEAGIRSFVVNVHHFPDKIIDYIRDTPELAAMDISISDERDLLRDTGGGIRYAANLLGDSPFLIHNVDIVSDLDIPEFISSVRPDALSTLLVSRRETSRYLLFNDEMRLVGWTNVSTGEVKTPFRGLDAAACRKFAFAGIHLVSPGIFSSFNEIDAAPASFPLFNADGQIIESSCNPLGQCFPVMDYYLRAAAHWPVYGAEKEGLTLIDAGKLPTLAQAESFLTGH